MKNKKTITKIRSATKKTARKTQTFMKKINKKATDISSTLKKQWDKEQPQREELKKSINKTLEDGIKIGGNVFKTIRKDVNEIKKQNKAKK